MIKKDYQQFWLLRSNTHTDKRNLLSTDELCQIVSSRQALIILITQTLFSSIMIKQRCAYIMPFEARQTVKAKVWVKGATRLRMQRAFTEEEKKRGDELLWYVGHNTPYWFLTGVINRICEAKLMKVNATDDKVHITHTHTRARAGARWRGANQNVEFLFCPFKPVYRRLSGVIWLVMLGGWGAMGGGLRKRTFRKEVTGLKGAWQRDEKDNNVEQKMAPTTCDGAGSFVSSAFKRMGFLSGLWNYMRINVPLQ